MGCVPLPLPVCVQDRCWVRVRRVLAGPRLFGGRLLRLGARRCDAPWVNVGFGSRCCGVGCVPVLGREDGCLQTLCVFMVWLPRIANLFVGHSWDHLPAPPKNSKFIVLPEFVSELVYFLCFGAADPIKSENTFSDPI